MQRLPYEAKVGIFRRMGYKPNPEHIKFHKDETNEVFIAGGWRAGKSVVVAAEAAPHTLIPSPRPYKIALIGPSYAEPREEFNYIVEFLTNALPKSQFDPDRHVSFPKEGKCSFTIPRQGDTYFATVETYTAQEAEHVRGFNADAVVICEAGGIEEESYKAIVGRTLSTGGFIIASGTMEKSQKWYHNKIKLGTVDNDEGVRSFKFPSWFNLVAFSEGRDDPKILRAERLLDSETFAIRIGAEPIRVTGVALKQLTEAHIQPVEFDPDLPVELWIDPGHTGAYAVLAVQRYDNQIRIFDEVYERFLSTPDIVRICERKEWWRNIDQDDPGVVDRAAKQKQAATGSSVLDVWFQEAGLWLGLTEQVIAVEDGLEQARIHLSMPNHIVISPRCKGLIAECDLGEFPEGFEKSQPWHYRTTRDGDYLGDNALTGADHSCTALIYGLIFRYGFLSLDDLEREFGSERLLSIKGSFRLEDDPDYGPEEITHMGMIR